MKLKYLLLLTFFYFSSTSNFKAQLADGSIAPNFTLADINGVTHDLYSILDSGYNVVLDFSAVWCGPCWGYHNTGILEHIYENYGPEGTNEVRVFFIEADGSSTLAELNGTGGNTQGDWVTGTPYPIILTSGQALNNAYDISYFPTMYSICASNKTTKKVDQYPYANLKSAIFSCPVTRSVDVAFDNYGGHTFLCNAGVPISGSIAFRNRGTNAITALTLEAYIGSTLLFTQPWTGNVASGAYGAITTPNFTINSSEDIRFELSLSGDQYDDNDDFEYPFTIAPELVSLQLKVQIKTDAYGSETGWTLEEEDGTLIQNINQGTYANSQTTYNYNYTLANNDCFYFTITDQYGDGMCCGYGNGYYLLTDNVSGDTLLFGGQYGAEAFQKLTTESLISSVKTLEHRDLVSIYPNPSHGTLTVETGVLDNYTLILRDVLGKEVYRHNETSANLILNLSELQGGNYVLSIMNQSGISNHKIQIID